MKKTLIALATLSAVTGTAFAQSTVTMSGVLEVAPFSSSKNTVGAETTKSSRTAQHNTWSTSVLNISAVEDLGGGLKASAVMISGVGDGFAARERTLGLSGGFGALRFGRFVPAPISGFHGFSGAGSATLVGSSYGLITGGTAAAPNAIHGQALAETNMERQDNVLQYTSPSFSGLTVNLNIVNNTSDSDLAAKAGKAATTQNGLHVGYSNGPLGLGLATNQATVKAEAATTAAAAATELKSTVNWIGASYNFGVASVFATNATRKSKLGGANAVDVNLMSFGVSAPVGPVTLRASTYSGKDKRSAAASDNFKLSGYQVSANYALSKRTSLIAATGTNDIKRDSGNTTGALRKAQGTTLTVNHTF